jgi:2'-5' RNA ligase
MESQYYRTFIGLPLCVDPSFLEARNNLMAALREERISWTLPEQFHVTLRFLGDTEASQVDGISSALRDGISVPQQRKLLIDGLDSFGPRKRPRVLWVGFEERSFFVQLKQKVDRILELSGIPWEEQPFRAHLTLGRVRSLKNLEQYYHTVEKMKHQFNSIVIFDRMVFFRSILGPRGPEYHVLEELKFLQ